MSGSGKEQIGRGGEHTVGAAERSGVDEADWVLEAWAEGVGA